jgi:hypothetical protein
MNINFKNTGSPSAEMRLLKGRRYGVSVKYYSGIEETAHKRIDYDVEIKIEEHEKGWQIDIDKQNVFFNQHEPDLVNEILSQAVTKAIYPVQCVINHNGLPVRGITNHEEIIKRWQENKVKINDKYQGIATDNFINVVDQRINNKVTLEKSMKYDLFWNLFFHPKYLSYGERSSIRTDLHLAVVPYKFPVRFSGLQSFKPEVTSYNSVQVIFKSDDMEAPDFLVARLKNNRQKFNMKLDVSFDLDATHFFPMHTTCYFELFYKDQEQNIQTEKRIHFTMYQLDHTSPFQEDSIIVEEKPKDKRSKLMKFIDTLVGD